jgi:type I restriction enzyme S subunit
MGSKYRTLHLVDLVTIHDTKRKPITKSKRISGIYPYYGASGITDYVEGYVFDGLYVLLAEDGDNLRTRNTPIAFTAKGKFWVNNHAHVLKGLDDLDTQYICYALQHAEIDSYISGSTRPKITQGDLKKIPITAPPLETRHKIAKLVNEFDQKIELNRQTNQTLEQMAQALFKSWFVDFDPVFDNALAAGTNVSDFPEALQQRALLRQERRKQVQQLAAAETKSKQLPEDILALFPSEFEQTDEPSIGIKGWIPKGWSVGKMNQHAIIEMGQSPKGDTYNSEGVGTPLVNGPVEFGPYFTKKTKWTTAPTKLSKQSDLIVCVRGSTTGRFVKSNGIYCLGRGVCSVRGVRSQVFTDEIFKNSIKTLLGLATGSTFPNWSRQILNEFKVIQPQSNVIDAFNNLISPNVQKAELNVIESEYLSELRDILLPKLISGELTIPDSMKTENIVNHQQPKESLSHHA